MKIDITKIDGYREDMSADEKLSLIGKYDVPDPDYTGFIKKDQFDKTASELAEWKKKHNAMLSEEEKKEAERAEAQRKIEEEIATLRKDKTVSESKAKYLALGYDEKLAEETAKALADGNMEKVFANQAVHIENIKKAAAAALLAGDQRPPAGRGDEDAPADKLKKQYDEAVKRGEHALAFSLMEKIKQSKK